MPSVCAVLDSLGFFKNIVKKLCNASLLFEHSRKVAVLDPHEFEMRMRLDLQLFLTKVRVNPMGFDLAAVLPGSTRPQYSQVVLQTDLHLRPCLYWLWS